MPIVIALILLAVQSAHAAGTQVVNVDFVAEPSELPSFVCVISAERPTCSATPSCRPRKGLVTVDPDDPTMMLFVSEGAAFDSNTTTRVTLVSRGKAFALNKLKVEDSSTIRFRRRKGMQAGEATATPSCACSAVLESDFPGRSRRSVELSDFTTRPPQPAGGTWREPDEALLGAMEALGLPRTDDQSQLNCNNPSVCPTWLDVARGTQYVRCVESDTSKARGDESRRLVAVVSVHGSIQSITDLSLTGSRLVISFPKKAFTLWISSIGGSYAPGLASSVLITSASAAEDKLFEALIALEPRCRTRSLQLPRVSSKAPPPEAIEIREAGKTLYSCTAETLSENRLLAKVPLGTEGVARSVHVRAADRWESVASWTSRAPPSDLRLAWTSLEFTADRDCLLPPTNVVNECPAATVGGAECTYTLEDNTCRYHCTAGQGLLITTPASVSFSIAGMEWKQPLEYAYASIPARPPPEVRRLYFDRFDDEAFVLHLEGPRGFDQTVKRSFLPARGVASVPMPGLQCNDSIRYTFEGRYKHASQLSSLDTGAYVALAPTPDTWRLALSLYGGMALGFGQIYKNVPYGVVGAELGRAFRWSPRWKIGRLSLGRVAGRIGTELHFTRRPYRTLLEELDSTIRHSTWYHRQLVSLSVGLWGISRCATCAWFGVWAKVAAGRGLPFFSSDNQYVGANDWIQLLELDVELPVAGAFSLVPYIGTLHDEDLWTFHTDFRGESTNEEQSGWRLFMGFQLRATL